MDKVLLYKLTLSTIENKEEVVVSKRPSFFDKLFKKSSSEEEIVDSYASKVVYTLTYNIDEDRFWFKKTQGDKVIDSHHTKKDFDGSFEILDSITERYLDILEDVDVSINIDYDIRTDKEREEILKKIKKHVKNIPLKKQEGYFLK